MKTAKTKPPKSVSRFTLHESASASALILAVVLTSLLAIIGVMFIMIARVDKMATSAISENKELNFAVETVVAKISQELALDVPRTDSNGLKLSEYYDYPGEEDKWLASLEPYEKTVGNYYWRQISDVYEKLGSDLELPAEIIPDNQKPSDVGDSNSTKGYPADADGDGVADSNWVIIPDMTSSKGKPIYAAVRIVDNGAMLNVNTAYEFDPNGGVDRIDGSSQLQINLAALARGGSASDADTIGELNVARGLSSTPSDVELSAYEDNLIWRIEDPCSDYLPFDISDELTIHGRYIIKQKDTITRLKGVWEYAFDRSVGYTKWTPYTDTDTDALRVWFNKSYRHPSDANIQQYYNIPHISTTYNMDRIIDPNGKKMLNINDINDANVSSVYNAIIDANLNITKEVAAQIAVNLVDFRDGATDPNVTTFDVNGKIYYGFETQPFISEIAAIIDTSEPNNNFYALELYNPFNNSVSLSDFVLSISNGSNISLSGTIDPNGYFVISNDLTKFTINTTHTQTSSGLKFSGNYIDNLPPGGDGTFDSWSNYNITLKRTVDGNNIILDAQDTNKAWFTPAAPTVFYAQRDTSNWHIVYQTMDPNLTGTLGSSNVVSIPRKNYNLSLANDKFVTVGDIARVLTVGPSPDPNDMIGVKLAAEPNEESVRLNLQNAAFQQIFNYLTVFDPTQDNIDNDGDGEIDETDPNKTLELKVPGRININTAPWYVIAQLPWMTEKLAQGIVAYRDAQEISGGPNYTNRLGKGFANIGQLNDVNDAPDDYRIGFYATDGNDLAGFPDLTAGDGAPDDFEERDVIFARISNLVTVRSDVFTAYILVRIGADGPQKRVMAILDRSNVYSGDGKVRIVALHPVPDPR